MYCYHCGRELPDDALFCVSCGTKQIHSESEPVAPVQSEPTAPTRNQAGNWNGNYAPTQNQAGDWNGNYPMAQPTSYKALVNLRKGSGMTVFSLSPNPGNLEVSDAGVSYTGVITSGNNHAYSFDQILWAKFEMSHAGLYPLFSYKVGLKTGQEYIYVYSPVLKTKMKSIDDFIKSRIASN